MEGAGAGDVVVGAGDAMVVTGGKLSPVVVTDEVEGTASPTSDTQAAAVKSKSPTQAPRS